LQIVAGEFQNCFFFGRLANNETEKPVSRKVLTLKNWHVISLLKAMNDFSKRFLKHARYQGDIYRIHSADDLGAIMLLEMPFGRYMKVHRDEVVLLTVLEELKLAVQASMSQVHRPQLGRAV
jgi:hypothetical protein